MDVKRVKRGVYTALIVAAIVLGIAALVLLSQTTRNSEQFGRMSDTLLLVNVAAAAVLLVLILGNLVRLLRDYRRRSPGTKLKGRMLIAFIGLAIAPLVIVYVFAIQFLNEGIESWFDVEIEEGLGDALVLSRAALDVRMRSNLVQTRNMALELSTHRRSDFVSSLGRMRRESGALELTVFGENYRIVATSAKEPAARLPALPPEDAILQVRQAYTYVGLDPAGEGRYQVRVLVALPPADPGAENLTLQALFSLGGRLGTLVDSVENTYSRYRELVFLRQPLKYSFLVTLTLVVLLSFLGAVYGAFFFARRIVAPLQSLVSGTRAVAEGDFDTRLPLATHDEIGFLIDSFNEMIHRLGVAREEARSSQQQVESERAQLEAILASLSTGVIALERDGRIRAANEAASAILQVDLDGATGKRLVDLTSDNGVLAQFLSTYQGHAQAAGTEWREQLVLRGDSGRRVLVCACTEIAAEAGQPGGSVLVFDDVTALMQAQRDAAWGEVARRLAHEIKNPLTPIQLSAERIRRRYLKDMQGMEAQVLDRATHTIVQQVEAMRDMVNAFSEYARAPEINLSHFYLNQLIREVAYLYRSGERHPNLVLDLDEHLGEIEADSVRVRQLLHNLIRNAMEAMEDRDDPRVEIFSRLVHKPDGEYAEVVVRDNGPGFDPENLQQIFEPYVTTKMKGTGLGLAIVKKLVEEHGGSVIAENLAAGGACVSVRLPVRQLTRDGPVDGRHARPADRRERA